jgi:hypothetical protein
MIIIGVDYHPSDQYIAFVDTETGEYEERQLNHSAGEAEKFYRELATRGVSVRVGMEATGYSRWFERLLAELGMELWIGDAAAIKTKRVRKQKTDREDARLLLRPHQVPGAYRNRCRGHCGQDWVGSGRLFCRRPGVRYGGQYLRGTLCRESRGSGESSHEA